MVSLCQDFGPSVTFAKTYKAILIKKVVKHHEQYVNIAFGLKFEETKFVKHTFEVKGIYYGMLEFQATGTAW